MAEEIIVVSGLPRSGTSLMMQMLASGGIEVLTDNLRTADTDNPRGYYEFERVKKLKEDSSWVPEARGKAVKLVSQLLFDLPKDERYRIIFMQRDLDEMIVSQEKMLQRLGREAAPREEIKKAFTNHLDKLHRWLDQQPNMSVLRLPYAEVLADPDAATRRICEFLSGKPDPAAMIKAIDPSLYRNRKDGSTESR
ncbi:MAG: sulfotransferase [Isosphaeraceae bacterium]